MEAFQKNIDALENKIKIFIQKWTKIREENELLIERNRQLEEKLANMNIDKPAKSKRLKANQNSDNNNDSAFVVEALDGYIKQVDHCIERLNKELDG